MVRGAVPDLITVVVGFDQPTGLTGSSGACHLGKFMNKIYRRIRSPLVPRARGKKVDVLTGGLVEATEEVIDDYFLPDDSLPRFPNLGRTGFDSHE